jgi:hypothetical protein
LAIDFLINRNILVFNHATSPFVKHSEQAWLRLRIFLFFMKFKKPMTIIDLTTRRQRDRKSNNETYRYTDGRTDGLKHNVKYHSDNPKATIVSS